MRHQDRQRHGWIQTTCACIVSVLCLGVASNAYAAEQQVVAPDASLELQQTLTAAWQALGPDYKPRTEHLLDDGVPKYINRLISEPSPYLLQHAHNPVNWYPWGEEAFQKAKAENKPIFMSIGYSTCHWCHVMERESFEDEAIAAFMNEHFVSIKVDREQLPDVDALYMTAVQLLTGRGGWPMSSFLDAEARPFFGGTYFPPGPFRDLLERVTVVWTDQHDALMAEADRLTQALESTNQLAAASRTVGETELSLARDELLAVHDAVYGGFGEAPKFPRESALMFLLERARDHGDKQALDAAHHTLLRMAAGGIHDQIGGGFHRYSVDHLWLVPHFEKMLYNQASLARAYTLAWELTGDEQHADTARGILEYVLREMTSDEGLFYSATDADSEGREGAFFTWTQEALDAVLDPDDARLAATIWGIDHVGNFEGETIPFQPLEPASLAARLELSPAELKQTRERLANQLLRARGEREWPLRDDKVLTGWNGMMIGAFAEAAAAFDSERYLNAATRAAEQLWATAWSDSGGLLRSRYLGKSTLAARQTDHAWLADGLLSLYDATGDEVWLDRAVQIIDAMEARFAAVDGGYYLGGSAVAGAPLVMRPKNIHDASTASGNGVALSVFARLFDRLGEREHELAAQRLIAAFAGLISTQRGSIDALMSGLAEHSGNGRSKIQYAGRGKARARAELTGDGRIRVNIALDDGWHLNADKPLQDYLIGTAITDGNGVELVDARYPEAEVRRLAFQSEALALYEGEVGIEARLPTDRNAIGHAVVRLRLQVCSDEVCLAPETLEWSLLAEAT